MPPCAFDRLLIERQHDRHIILSAKSTRLADPASDRAFAQHEIRIIVAFASRVVGPPHTIGVFVHALAGSDRNLQPISGHGDRLPHAHRGALGNPTTPHGVGSVNIDRPKPITQTLVT